MMTELYFGYTLVYYSGCCGTGGVGVQNGEGLSLFYRSQGFSDLHLFPSDREAKAWIDAGATVGDAYLWERE